MRWLVIRLIFLLSKILRMDEESWKLTSKCISNRIAAHVSQVLAWKATYCLLILYHSDYSLVWLYLRSLCRRFHDVKYSSEQWTPVRRAKSSIIIWWHSIRHEITRISNQCGIIARVIVRLKWGRLTEHVSYFCFVVTRIAKARSSLGATLEYQIRSKESTLFLKLTNILDDRESQPSTTW